VLTQLDFAPLPGGSDPLLLHWFGHMHWSGAAIEVPAW